MSMLKAYKGSEANREQDEQFRNCLSSAEYSIWGGGLQLQKILKIQNIAILFKAGSEVIMLQTTSIGRVGALFFYLVISCLLVSLPAKADYYLVPAKTRLPILVTNWKITINGDKSKLTVARNTKNYSWDIDTMWLADRVCSDSICTGQYQQTTKAYLEKLQAGDPKIPLLAELVDVKGKGEMFIAGLWQFNSKKGFEGGSQYGSIAFGWSPDEVKSFKTQAGYEEKAKAVSEKNWAQIKN